MAWSPPVAYDDGGDDDFEPASQLAILRRAVAEIALPRKVAPAPLAGIRADLRRFCALAELLLVQVRQERLAAAVSAVGASLTRRLPTRALLEQVRLELYGYLVQASAALPLPEHALSPSGPLAMRAQLSDFYGALLPETADESVWALTVATAELSLLLDQPALDEGPARERRQLSELGARTRRWSRAGRSSAEASALYAEVTSSAKLLEALSRRSDVRRHDERVLRELTQLLSHGFHDYTLVASAADRLSALRGLDHELDRLIVALPLEPISTLARIAHRVRQLSTSRMAS